jgi:hypothetical protein
MPYDFHWHDEERSIIWLDMYDEVSWDALHKVFDEILAEIDATSQRVDLIIHDKAGMPKGNAIASTRVIANKVGQRNNIGLIAVIGANQAAAFVKIILDVLAKFVKFQQVEFVNTAEEAEAIIEKNRKEAKINESNI